MAPDPLSYNLESAVVLNIAPKIYAESMIFFGNRF